MHQESIEQEDNHAIIKWNANIPTLLLIYKEHTLLMKRDVKLRANFTGKEITRMRISSPFRQIVFDQ